MSDAYTEGMKQGRYIQDTNPDLPDQLQASHARHCAIECGFIQKPEQEQYIQGYLAGYAKEEVPNLGERFQLVVREKEGDAHASR